MEEAIDNVKELLDNNPNRIYYRWLGTIFSNMDVMSRLDKAYMFCVYKTGNNYKYCRLIGYPDLDKNKDEITFTTALTPRITSGRRRGRIVPMPKLYEDEAFVWSGIYKDIELSRNPDEESTKFNPNSRTDQVMINLLDDISDGPVTKTDKVEVPGVYICSSKSRTKGITLREQGNAVQWFSENFGETHLQQAIQGNLNDDMVDKVSEYAGRTKTGKERCGFPFAYFTGKGVRAVDIQNMGKWNYCEGMISDKFMQAEDHVNIIIK